MSAAKPVYQKLKSDILAMIENGSVLPGEMLPPEKELSEKYGISRGSTRVALSELEAEKLIEKKPGRGAFVNDPMKAGKQTKPKTIGIDIAKYIGSSNSSYYRDFVHGANEACMELNCRIQFACNKELESLEVSEFDGLIMMHYNASFSEKLFLLAKKIPLIVINRFIENGNIGYVSIDNVMDSFRATEYLIKQGHEHIAFVGNNSSDGQLRQRGYTSALKTYGLEVKQELIVTQPPGNDIFSSVRTIITKEHPTAIFVASGFYYTNFVDPIARELQVAIPDDLSLICFDDIENEVFHHGPPLTCVRQPLIEMGRTAITRLATFNGTPVKEKFQSELVIRQSCRNISRPTIVREEEEYIS